MMKMSDGYLVDAVALYAKLSVCLIQRDDVTLSEEVGSYSVDVQLYVCLSFSEF